MPSKRGTALKSKVMWRERKFEAEHRRAEEKHRRREAERGEPERGDHQGPRDHGAEPRAVEQGVDRGRGGGDDEAGHAPSSPSRCPTRSGGLAGVVGGSSLASRSSRIRSNPFLIRS